MSGVSFQNLEVSNFLSVGEGKLSLDGRGLLLISGENRDDPSANSNGAGKSSVVDALCWALFGETARGVTGDGVVNRSAGKGTRVALTVKDDTNVYQVIRHRKHKTGKNRLELWQDGVDVTKGTDALTQAAVETIIGCSMEVFKAGIYAGQEQMPNLPAMTDKELKLLIEEAAGIRMLEAAYEKARGELRQATSDRDVKKASVDAEARAVEMMERSEAQSVAQHADWEVRQEGVIAVASDEAVAAVKRLEAAKAAVDEDAEKKLRLGADKISAMLAAGQAPNPHKSALVAVQRQEMSWQSAAQSAKRDFERAQSAENSVADKIGKPCGECGRPFDEEHLETAIAAAKARTTQSRAALTDAIKTLTDVKAELARAQAEFDAFEAARTDTSDLVSKLGKVNARLSELVAARAAVARAEDAAKRAQAAADAEKRKENPYIKTVEDARGNLAKAVDRHARATVQLAELEAAVEVATQVASVFAPTGIRGQILDQVTPYLNDRTAHYLGALSDGNLSAEWHTVATTAKGEAREKFHIKVDNKTGAEGFEGLSGGEKRKVRIATALALQDLVASRAFKPIRLFIGDELDDALDVSGLERLMGILEEKARSVGTVLLISHAELSDWVRSEVTVVKEGGQSTIKEKL